MKSIRDGMGGSQWVGTVHCGQKFRLPWYSLINASPFIKKKRQEKKIQKKCN